MNWFGGSVVEAIQRAKSNRGLFIVFVSGDDESSQQMTLNWDDSTVIQLMSSSNSVAIRLDPTSPTGQQFSQIYPIMCVPCVYFIGINGGVPLEVQGGLLKPAKIVDAFKNALQLHSSQTSSLPAQENRAETADAEVAGVATSGDASSNSTEISAEKKERASQLLAKRRDQKAEEEKEEQKKKEAERRKLGQDLGKLKEWKADVERKEVETSMKKEKEEAKTAREKVRADLERDRQERSLKYNAEKTAREIEVQKKKDAVEAAAAESIATTTAQRRESARIQFRLPDGSTVTQTFKSSGHLSEARDFIQQRLNVNNVSLVCTYPRRTFTEEDMTSAMLELNLAPTAALIVLLSNNSSRPRPQPPACEQGFISSILAYLFLIWTFFCNLFSGAPTPAVTRGRDAPQEVDAPTPSTSSGVTASNPGGMRLRQQGIPSVGRYQESNIHRLHNADDSSSDDENATWNGNSTQQK